MDKASSTASLKGFTSEGVVPHIELDEWTEDGVNAPDTPPLLEQGEGGGLPPPPPSAFLFFVSFLSQRKTRTTACFCLTFGVLGLCVAAPGPALLALRDNTGGSVAQMGYIFSARSVGYLIGGGVGGPVFDRFNGNRTLAISLFLTAIGSFLIPATNTLWMLATIMCVTGMSMGFLDTGGNVSIIWLHGENVGPYMQALHFSFGFGAFISPMIVGGFMHSFNGDPAWAFRAFGLLCIPLSVWMWSLKVPKRADDGSPQYSVLFYEKVVVFLTSVFLFFYVGAEVSAGGYLYSYSVLENMAGETESAFLTSGFWGALCLGRLLAVPASMYFSAAQILSFNLMGCIIGSTIWLLFLKSRVALWVGCIVFGLGMSSSFPTAIHLAESYMSLTGRLASLLVVGACFGEMVIPILTSSLFAWTSPVSLMVVLFSSMVAGTGAFGLVLFFGRSTQKKMGMGVKGSFTILPVESGEQELP